MKKYLFITLSLVILTTVGIGQDLSQNYYSYIYNWYNVNPAYTAKSESLSAILNARKRANINANNAMLGIRTPFGENQGFGGKLISDNRAAFQVIIADLTYGYKLRINTKHTLYLGLSAGINNRAVNTSKIENYELLDQTDPSLQSANLNATNFSSGAGVVYNFENFEFGLSFPQLIGGSGSFFENLYLTGSREFKLKNNIGLKPSLFFITVPSVKDFAGIQLKGDYKKKAWIQMGYQTNETLNLGAGANVKMLGLGYNYTFSNKRVRDQSAGTHEVILTLNIIKQRTKPTVAENNSTQLEIIMARLNAIDEIKNKKEIRTELDKIKAELIALSTIKVAPKNAGIVTKQLNAIEEKINEIETKLKKTED